MRFCPSLLIISLGLLLSCESTVTRALNGVEEKINSSPQESLQEISHLDPKSIHSKSNRARHALLYSMALDKCYIDTSDDSLAQNAVQYYRFHGPIRYRMLSEYSLGRVYANAGNKAGAMVSFIKAKDLAQSINDLHYLGLAARNIAELYGSSYDEDTEIKYYKESFDAFNTIGEELYAAYSRAGEARAHLAKGRLGMADSLYHLILPYARKNHKTLYSIILKDLAYLEVSPQRLNSNLSLAYYDTVSKLHILNYRTVDYGTIAIAYELLHRKDSVEKYLALAEKCARTSLDSVHLCNTKIRIYNNNKEYEKANQQMKIGIDAHNRLVYRNDNQILANAISDFSRQEARQHSLVARNRLYALFLLCLAVVSLICVIIQQIIIRKKQIQEKNRLIQEKEKKLEEDLNLIREISEELQLAHEERSAMNNAVYNLIHERIAIVKNCADAYDFVNNSTIINNPRDPYRYLDEDPIKKKTEKLENFIQALDTFRKDESLFSLLEQNVNSLRNNIVERLRSACSSERTNKPIFNEEDYRIMSLIYAGIPDKTIAFLMDMTCAAIRTRKSRYKERLLQKDIENGAFFVKEMANLL